MSGFEKGILEKIKNKEDLSFNEMQTIERLLTLHSVYNELLSIQIGLYSNNYELEYVKGVKE